jgi:hypothetical protein
MLSNPFLQLLFKIIIFVFIIYTLQCGFEYLKDTYSKPRVKDLVNTQIKKYKEIVSEINNTHGRPPIEDTTDEGIFNDRINVEDMNTELLTFMNSQTQQYITTS